MFLEYTCASVSASLWKSLMKGKRKSSYTDLKVLIKLQLPELYWKLGLKWGNPYYNATYETDTHYILTHNATEYFINKGIEDE